MPQAHDLADWITQLGDSKSNARFEAARHLHQAGVDLCEATLARWNTDSEFHQLTTSAGEGITVGIAVRPESFDRIRTANGSPRLADVPPDQDAREFELHFGAAALDILTTRDPSGVGAIARYLNRLGEGIQQVEVSVSNVDRATEILRSRFGLEPVYPATHPGANGTRVNFFLVAAGGKKVLVELVQTKP